MTVPFSAIPENLRVGLFFVEFDNSMANHATDAQRSLLIGGMLASGTATPGIPVRVSSPDTVGELAGKGSLLQSMMTAYHKNDSAADVWILPLKEEAGTMVAATGTIKVTSVPTATGVVSLYIGGVCIRQTVVVADKAEGIAAALVKVINEQSLLPVTAIAEKDTVKLTAKNLGAVGNSIDLRLNFLGSAGGETTPAGLSLTITPMSGGRGAPGITSVLGNLQDQGFDFIVNPYDDTTSLDAIKAFLSDVGGRWAWDKQLYGHAFTTLTGTYAQLGTKGQVRNNQHETIMGVNKSPSPPWVWSAAYTGAAAVSLRNDPARPVQSLAIQGVLAPVLHDRFEVTERNSLLYSGISSFTVDDDGTVRIENLITTYQKNSYGNGDDSYLEVETLFNLMFVTRYLRTAVTSKFGRMSLAANGTRFAPGAAIVTPNVIKADQIAEYGNLVWNGYAQDAEAFAKNIIVEPNSKNPNRVDVLWPGTMMNQLRIFALLNQFRSRAEPTGG